MVYWSRKTQAAVEGRYRAILDSWNTPHSEHRIPSSQGESFAIVAGAPEAHPVVFLPGSMATSAMWLATMDALLGRFRVIAVDIIGDAGFSAPSRPRMKSDAHARWLDDVLSALSVQSASFVGASLGGWLALDYAIRRSSRVTSLVLLAPAGIGRIRPSFLLRTAPLLFLGPWGHRKALNLDMGFNADDARAGGTSFMQLFDTVRSGFVARMQPIPAFSEAELRGLTMPMLVVIGGRDVVVDSAETLRRVGSAVPSARVMMLPRAGHGLIDTTQMVGDFLTDCASHLPASGARSLPLETGAGTIPDLLP